MKHSLEKYYELFETLVCHFEPDGLGGTRRVWTPGVSFRGTLSQPPCTTTTAGGQVVPRHTPVLLHEAGVELAPQSWIRRSSDGAVYKTLSASAMVRSPVHSDLPFAEVMLERLVIPC